MPLGGACDNDLNCKTPGSYCLQENGNKRLKRCACSENYKKLDAIYNLPEMCVESVSIGSTCNTTEQCELSVKNSICSSDFRCSCVHGSAVNKNKTLSTCSILRCDDQEKKDTCLDHFSNRRCKKNSCECDDGFEEDSDKFECVKTEKPNLIVKMLMNCYDFIIKITFLLIIKSWQ